MIANLQPVCEVNAMGEKCLMLPWGVRGFEEMLAPVSDGKWAELKVQLTFEFPNPNE